MNFPEVTQILFTAEMSILVWVLLEIQFSFYFAHQSELLVQGPVMHVICGFFYIYIVYFSQFACGIFMSTYSLSAQFILN